MMTHAQSRSLFKFTIAKKLILASALNLILMLMVGSYTLGLMALIGSEIEEVAEIDLPLVKTLAKIETHLLELEILFEKSLRLGEEIQIDKLVGDQQSSSAIASLTRLNNQFIQTNQTFRDLSDKVVGEIDDAILEVKQDINIALIDEDIAEFMLVKDSLKIIKQAHQQLQRDSLSILDTIISGQWDHKQNQSIIDAVEKQEAVLEQQIMVLLQEVESFTENSLLIAEQHEKQGIKGVAVLVSVSILLSLLISWLIARQIIKPVSELKLITDSIALGELNRTVSWKNADEIGELSTSINLMIATLNAFAEQADAIARGDFSKEVVTKSHNDRLGVALHEMKTQILERSSSLAKSESINKGIVNTAVDGIITITPEGEILSVNAAVEKMFKYSAVSLLGRNIKTLMPEPFHSEHDAYLSQYKSSGVKNVIGQGREVVALRSDASTFPIFLSVGEVKLDDETIFTGFIRDISAQKQYELDILRSESLNKALVNTSLDGIVSISPEGVILSCNSATETLFNYTSEQLLGSNVNMLMPEPYSSEHDSYLKNYLNTGVKKVIGKGRELVGLRSDGSQFPIFLSVGEVQLESGVVFTGFIRDISQQKQFELDMIKSEQLNRGMVDTCLDAILSISSKGVVIACNTAAETLFQYGADELIGNKINELMPSPFTEEHDGYLNNYLTSGVKKVIGKGREVIGLKKDGSTFPMYLTVGQVKQGDEVVFTGFVRDITQEKQYQQDLTKINDDLLKQNELKSQVSIINELTQGATELNAMSDEIISVLAEMMNAGYGVLYTYMKSGEEKGLSLSGSYAFKVRKAILPIIALGEGLVGQCGKEKKTILLTQVPADYIQINSGLGEKEPLNVLVVPILFESELMGVIELASFKIFQDEQVEMIELISSSLGIVINNLRNQQQTQELLVETQRQSQELQAQQEELKSSNESLMEQTQLLKTSEEELKQQTEELKVSNEELEEKQVFLKQQRDEIDAAKNDLTIKANELALASKYKSEFLANMSHELRTPLNSLLLLAKGLSDNKKQHLDKTEVEDAKIIFDGGNNLLCLINDIMDLSKVEAGKLNIHIEEVNLNALCRNLKQVFDPIANSRGLSFIIDIDKGLSASFTSDGHRVEQVLRNLLSNAFKFTETGSVTLHIADSNPETKFTHSSLDVEHSLAFEVIDTGIGIPADKLHAIFEAFQQQDGSTSRKYGGTGLGLTIARELTRLLAGEIQLQSQPNFGSTFTLYLPNTYDSKGVEPKGHSAVHTISSEVTKPMDFSLALNKDNDNALNSEHSQVEGLVKPLTTMQPYPAFIADDRKSLLPGDRSLLIIDDDENFAKILRDHAREHGYKCLVAGDGRMGIYLAQEYQPSGIILDIMLPDIDGHQVLEQLKFSLKTRHIPVEIISAHSDDKNSALVQGAIGLQTKPISQDQLLTVFDEIKAFSSAELRHVLVIEDDIANQTSIIRLLENSDIDIKCVDNGSAGVDEIMSGEYDCVILDLGLPDISGFEVLKRIEASELERVPPVIVYTGQEISDEEQDELNKYSSTIVIKGVGSAERLLDDISLFLHDIESRFCSESKAAIHMLHDEDSMLKGRKILLVDDDMRNTYALSKLLIETGFEVDMAHNGKEAVEQLLEEKNFELVLMDTMMPEMDGYEATRLIREMAHYKDLPIIALTAKTMAEDRERSLNAGASEYLTKPIDLDKLLSIMRIWLFKH